MIKVIISFLMGMFVGGTAGFFVACLMESSRDD